jgi:hypothetical protein
MTVTLASWLDEHPAPAGLLVARADATDDGPYRGGVDRVEIVATLARMAGVITFDATWFVLAAISGTVVYPWTAAFVAPAYGAAIAARRAEMRRRLPRVILEGTRATMSDPDGARELELATVTALDVLEAGQLEKSTSSDQLIQLTANGARAHAWRGRRTHVAWVADLLAVAIVAAGGRA